MILIADSGSTKCDWLLVEKDGTLVKKETSLGINPVMFSPEEIYQRIGLASQILAYAEQVEEIFFYSAGCGLEENQKLMQDAIHQLYPNAKIEVQSDLVAAVRATAKEPSIICIVGTGSNTCYYDGEKIHFGFDSLGYTVMDEASGSYFGKQLLRDYFYKRMPKNIAENFAANFELDTEKVLQNLYKEPMPAKYLASFAKIIFSELRDADYFKQLLTKGFEDLIAYQIKLWPKHQELPVHFIGSIAHYAKEILEKTLAKNEISLGRIVQMPVKGLVLYHVNKYK